MSDYDKLLFDFAREVGDHINVVEATSKRYGVALRKIAKASDEVVAEDLRTYAHEAVWGERT